MPPKKLKVVSLELSDYQNISSTSLSLTILIPVSGIADVGVFVFASAVAVAVAAGAGDDFILAVGFVFLSHLMRDIKTSKCEVDIVVPSLLMLSAMRSRVTPRFCKATISSNASLTWAFAHLDTDGEGMGQRAQTGYLFILNVLFRPSLMVVGFVLGSQMVDILTEYVVALFPSIIANANVDSWTGLIKICAYISAFVIILQTIVSISFSMIRFVPDQVLGWLGGNANNNIGQQAEDVAGGAAKNAFAMRGSMSGPGVMDKAKQANQANQDRNTAQKNKEENDKTQASRHGEIMAQNNAMMDRLGGLGNGGNMGGVAGAGKGQRN